MLPAADTAFRHLLSLVQGPQSSVRYADNRSVPTFVDSKLGD
jgi:hypothetical protein